MFIRQNLIQILLFLFPDFFLPFFADYRDFNNVDWDGLFSFMSGFDCSPIFNNTDVDLKSSHVSSMLNDLYSYVPIVRKRICNNDNSWMESFSFWESHYIYRLTLVN